MPWLRQHRKEGQRKGWQLQVNPLQDQVQCAQEGHHDVAWVWPFNTVPILISIKGAGRQYDDELGLEWRLDVDRMGWIEKEDF